MRSAVLALLVLGGLMPPARLVAQPKQLPPHLVAPTDALTPADERKAFTLPPGFDVQLVASEPDIQKPMQMAWDARGRLWVTTSYHYPFAAEKGKATDKLFVLSDFGPDGKAKTVKAFAADLNIPIGVLPLPDCNSCIVSSVGEIRKYTDTDGDGKADRSEVLFAGFGSVDTHGMTNSFTLMPDGWVYACHGFRNDSTVKGKDGHEVKMNSGHTFRFRPDGSRIEVYSRGQVNPFGMAIDPWHNLYTADCHSRPITQIIPGAYYQSFGKPHDGLGFAGHVTPHDHGSTGLCGITWYDADQFPKDYLGCVFVGNVVTNRINFDRIEWKGATPVAKELPDFLTSTDRWFRPVDIKLGPDGALYVADFYNKIIGHYEVPLTYPGRDKDRGRIWRIVWKGKDGASAPPKFHRADFTKASDADLLHDLFHPNLTVRFLAGHQLRRRAQEAKSAPTIEPIVQKLLNDKDRSSSAVGWNLSMMEAADGPIDLANYTNVITAAKNSDNGFLPEHLTGHLVRALNGRTNWGEGERKILIDVIKSFESVHQRRAAVEAAALHPHADLAQSLIDVLTNCPEYDTHLRHAARVALRNCLRDADAWPRNYDPVYAEMALAIPSAKAADYLSSRLDPKVVAADRLAVAAEHVALHGDDAARDRFVDLGKGATDWPKRLAVADGLRKGVAARGLQLRTGEQTFAAEVAKAGLAAKDAPTVQAGCELAGGIKLAAVLPDLIAVAKDTARPDALRVAALTAATATDPAAALPVLSAVVTDAAAPVGVRDRAGQLLGGVNSAAARAATRAALKTAPYRVSVALAVGLAGSRPGGEALLAAVKAGEASPRVLQEKAVVDKLRVAAVPNLDAQLADLTKGLQPLDARLADLIKSRAAAFTAAKPDKELGAKLFTKHCGACHRIGEQGGKIAPQLDGIGTRGLDRLLEDILDPNRNVEPAFRARVITTKDDRTVTGLLVRTEGEVLVLADDQGKELRVAMKDVDKNRETTLSAMPANFGEVVPPADFVHLLAYLLEQRAKDPPKK